jgi:hypothetical protein
VEISFERTRHPQPKQRPTTNYQRVPRTTVEALLKDTPSVIMADENASIITPDEFLFLGLKLVGYKRRRIRRAKKKTNIDRFVAHFGSVPCI